MRQCAVDLSRFADDAQFQTARGLIGRLKAAGHAAYIVGGFPRDFLLGKRSKDIDIATAATPEEVAALFPDARTIGAAFGVVLCVENGFPFEIASFRTEGEYRDGRHPANLNYTTDPALDSQRRDFTINAFYLDPEAENILDFHDGLTDLKKARLRTVGEAPRRFGEDYLRMLRAVRFAVCHDFEIDDTVRDAVIPLAEKVATLSVERIRSELDRMLLSNNPVRAVALLDELGLLPHVLPEIAAMKGVEQHPTYHPEGDVFVHTMCALARLSHPNRITVWATLLHDIGKPRTLTYDAEGIPHFYGHENVGAVMAARVMERLKFDNVTADAVAHVVKTHMKFVHFPAMRTAKQRRILADPMLRYEMEILRVDTLGSHGALEVWLEILDRLAALNGEPSLPPPLITGGDVIARGIKPGPKIGRILETFRDLQLSGELTSRDEALKKLQQIRGKNGNK